MSQSSLFTRSYRRLLQLDRPVLVRTESEVEAEVERNYPWNFLVNLLDGAFFWFGASFASSTTILPLFVSKLTHSPLAIGLVAVIAQAAWFLPQIFTANAVERLARKKPVAVNLGFFTERLPIFVLVLSAMLALAAPSLALVLFLVGYAWHGLGAGLVATAWQDLLARCFPVNRRGRFLGLTSFIGAGTGVLGAGVSTWLLEVYAFPVNFVFIFGIAALGITISWFWLTLVREPVQAMDVPVRSNREFLGSLPDLVRRNHNFRRFIVARLLMTLGGMGTGFVTVAAVQRWDVPDATVGIYTALLLTGSTMGNLVFGFFADRSGHKAALELGILASLLGFAIAWLAPAPEFYYAVFVLLGIGSSSVVLSGLLVVMEFCEPARRPTYLGVANTSVGLVACFAPLLGATLAALGYGLLFAIAATVLLFAFILMRWWVKEPRWAVQTDMSAEPQN